jgi:hypothetical protein
MAVALQLLRRGNQDIDRGRDPAQRPQQTQAFCARFFNPSQNNQQVQVAVRARVAPGVRPKQDDPFRAADSQDPVCDLGKMGQGCREVVSLFYTRIPRGLDLANIFTPEG